MKKEINEVNKGEEIAIGGGLSSLRRKYLKGGTKSSKLGKGDLSMDAGEKIISIKKEIRTQKEGALGGDSSIEEVKKLKKIKVGDVDRESNSAGKLSISRQNRESKNDSKGQTKQTITKIEISNNSENKSGLRGNKSVSNNNTTSQNQKGGNSSKISKTTEITTTTNTSGVNRGNDRRSRGKNEVTTTTTITKTTKTEGNIAGNKEVVKTTTTKEGGNSSRKTRTKEEVTTTKTTSTNQRSGGRGNSTQNQVTTTKTTTTNTLKNGNDKKVVSSQSTSRINNKNESNKISSTNQRSLVPQKSTPALRGNNVLPNKDNLKNDKKRPLSTIPQEPEFRNNIVRITIDETGKIPKKEYVLNVRKTDVIRRKNKIRMVYNNDPNKKSVTTEFNHNIKVIKNVTKDLPTVDSLPAGAKIIHRYNYSFNPNIPNTSRHEINETGKIPVKQVQVSPRKNNVIKTERKPLKMTYEMYNSTHQGGTKVIPLPNNLKGKKGIEQVKKENNKESKKINVKGAEGSSSTRIRSQASNNRNKGGETTTTTKVTETKISRGKSEGNKTGGKTEETKVTITKTTETRTGKSGNELKITKKESESGKKEGRGDRSSKKNKFEPVTTGQVTVNESGKSKRNRVEGLSTKKEEKLTTSKVTVTKTTESSNTEGSGRFRAGKSRGSKEENKDTSTKTEGNKITTTTTTTKVETSEGGDGNVTKIRKFKSHRMFKK